MALALRACLRHAQFRSPAEFSGSTPGAIRIRLQKRKPMTYPPATASRTETATDGNERGTDLSAVTSLHPRCWAKTRNSPSYAEQGLCRTSRALRRSPHGTPGRPPSPRPPVAGRTPGRSRGGCFAELAPCLHVCRPCPCGGKGRGVCFCLFLHIVEEHPGCERTS